jgi:hypothetical protein
MIRRVTALTLPRCGGIVAPRGERLMSREVKASAATPPRQGRRAEVEISSSGDAALVRVYGMLDENFAGFGDPGASTVVLDVSGLKFITSFGVRQWLRAMAGLPATVRDVYLAGCPRIFVEQLNMILNFGGTAQILTLLAPYRCVTCGIETEHSIDAVAQGAQIASGTLPERQCAKCNGKLMLDEIPEMYFACLQRYGPRKVSPVATQLIAMDTRALPKHVIKATVLPRRQTVAAVESPNDRKGHVTFWIVLGVLLAVVATGLYMLVGPS